MSAITGIFYRNGRLVESELIKKMNKTISYRGPDGAGELCQYSVAFGHQMLFTTPESLEEKLPFHDPKNGLMITADARIDNRNELLHKLDVAHAEISDSYLILRSYEKWGEKCVEYLLGDFVFAIWDENKKNLFCARDHLGVKPFYYYLDDEKFVFGTEIKALLSIPDLEFKLNENAVANHIYNNYEEREQTFYENIYRLPASNYLIINSKNHEFVNYWSLNPEFEIKMDSDELYASKFKEIFEDAVSDRLRSFMPVGSQLSGGLDSSSIVCIARNILKDGKKNPLKTFSAIFEDVPESDERKYIKEVLSEGFLEDYYVNADRIPPLKELEKFLPGEDEPFWIPNLFLSLGICREAQNNNVRILLSGEDGDTVLSHGSGVLKDLFHEMKLIELMREFRGLADGLGFKNALLLFGAQMAPHNIRKLWWRLNGLKNGPSTSDQIINPEFANSIENLEHDPSESFDTLSFARKNHYEALSSPSIQRTFEVVDTLAAAFQMEIRYPFYDIRLVEYCLALPSKQKLDRGWSRVVLRRAMENILPRKIQWRRFKGNLGHNFDHSIKFEEDTINKCIKNPDLIKKYIDIDALQKIYLQCQKANYSNQYTIKNSIQHKIKCNSYNLWKIITLAQWLKKSVDKFN